MHIACGLQQASEQAWKKACLKGHKEGEGLLSKRLEKLKDGQNIQKTFCFNRNPGEVRGKGRKLQNEQGKRPAGKAKTQRNKKAQHQFGNQDINEFELLKTQAKVGYQS